MKQSGYTLIEIMIVTAVVAILAAIAIPSYQNYMKEAEITVLIEDIDAVKKEVIGHGIARNINLCNDPQNMPIPDLSSAVGVDLKVVTQDLHYAKPLAILIKSGDVDIAKNLYQHYKGSSVIGPNPIVTATAVSFTIQLVQAPCKQQTSNNKQPSTHIRHTFQNKPPIRHTFQNKPPTTNNNQCPNGQTAYTIFDSGFHGSKSAYCLDTCKGEVDVVGRCCAKSDMGSTQACRSGSYTESQRHSQIK